MPKIYRFTPIILVIILLTMQTSTAATSDTAFDLALTALDTAPSGAPGSLLYTSFTVENVGNRISMTDTIILYLSSDPEIDPTDYQIGEKEVSFLRPGRSQDLDLVSMIPQEIPAGTYYSGAILTIGFDLMEDINLTNNSITGPKVQISGQYSRPQEWYNEQINDLVLTYTNEERKKRNLGTLTRDESLDIIAREQSGDMAERDFFDHVNPDGEDPIDRADRHGYDQLKYLSDGKKFFGIGENIVKIPVGDVFRFGDINPDNPDQIAAVAVESFMNSISHKTTLLLPEFEVIGLGTAFDGKNYYITQNFF